MNTSSYKKYLLSCSESLKEEKEINFSSDVTTDIAQNVFKNLKKAKKIASDIKTKFINKISDNLVIFDKKFTENSGHVHWCIAYNDFEIKLRRLLEKGKTKSVNLFPSYFSEELGLKNILENADIEIDNEQNDTVIFFPKFGIVNTGSLFLEFSSSFDMEQVLSSNTKIFVLPITDFVLKPDDIEIFVYLYSVYKNHNDFPYLSSLFTPQPLEKNDSIHVFLVDNSRSNIIANKEIRSILNCINCDACKTVCPVYNMVGDKPFDNVFSGPYANVVLPFLENTDNYKHLCFSCTNCGNCSSVCPMNIPVSELIIRNKKYFFENKIMDISDIRISKVLSKTLSSRKLMNQNKVMKYLRIKLLINNSKSVSNKFIFSSKTFNQQYGLKEE
ncbi:lactate utilization protein [bacterium]|nr:lactate utilization protein [bacterium]